MHLKVLIADNEKIVAGSYNYTNKAKSSHDEVIVVIEMIISPRDGQIILIKCGVNRKLEN